MYVCMCTFVHMCTYDTLQSLTGSRVEAAWASVSFSWPYMGLRESAKCRLAKKKKKSFFPVKLIFILVGKFKHKIAVFDAQNIHVVLQKIKQQLQITV